MFKTILFILLIVIVVFCMMSDDKSRCSIDKTQLQETFKHNRDKFISKYYSIKPVS